MQNIAQIYIMLSFFIYTISSAIIYMIIRDILDARFEKKVKELDNSFNKEVLRQLQSVQAGKNLTKMDIDYVKQNIKKRTYSRALINQIQEFNKDLNNHDTTKKYMLEFDEYIETLIKKCRKKDDTIKIYCATVLGEFKISSYEVNNYLTNCLNTKSVYLRVASLEAISKIGKLDNLINGIRYISDNNKYINSKLFIDILNQFGSDKYLLDRSLINNFEKFNIHVQKDIVEHFKNNKRESVKEDLIKFLNKDDTDKEVKISIIKYFSVIKFEKAKDEIIKYLKNSDWEYRAVCASSLSKYKDKESIDVLLESITDKNWHVRYNSAISILDYDDSVADIVFKRNDKYSTDILFYAMFMKNRISYEEYMDKIRQIEVSSNV